MKDSEGAFEEIEISEGKEEADKIKIFSLDELMAKEFPPASWVVDKLIPKSGLVALSGVPGSYKSWLAEYIALCVAQGKSVFDRFDSDKGVVLIIDRENHYSMLKERFKMLGETKDLSIHFLDMDFSVEDEEMVNRVIEEIKRRDVSLVIIDSLIRIHGQDENTSTGMAKVFKQLRKIQDAGSAVMFTHHHRKKIGFMRSNAVDDLRGSTDILAAVDSHLSVSVTPEGTIKVSQPKLRQEQAITGFTLQFDNGVFTYIGEVEEEKAKSELAKADIVELLSEGEAMRKDIQDSLLQLDNYGKDTINKGMKDLLDNKTINHRPGNVPNSKIYFLTDRENGSLLSNTYIDQTNRLPDSKEQTTEQTTTTKSNLDEGSLVQTTEQTTGSLVPFKDKIKKWDTVKLESQKEKGEKWFTDNPNSEETEEKKNQLEAIIDEQNKRTGGWVDASVFTDNRGDT